MAENDDIPFNRDFPLKPGVVEEVRPGVRRVLCDNPSPFTFTGTVSYIVGKGKVAIIDPGPDDEAHAKALLDAVRGETVTHILVTHTHRDHSPNTARIKAGDRRARLCRGAAPRLAAALREREAQSGIRRRPRLQAGCPGEERRRHRRGGLAAARRSRRPATPPTISPSPGRSERSTFVGDHVMGWSTSIVAPPDGSMIDYMASLERLAAREEDLYFSGHGPEIPEGPRYVRFLIRHRQAREASILHRLAKGEADIPTMVRAIYIGIDPRLTDCRRLFRAGASGGSGLRAASSRRTAIR